jgi:hypothetical protein
MRLDGGIKLIAGTFGRRRAGDLGKDLAGQHRAALQTVQLSLIMKA